MGAQRFSIAAIMRLVCLVALDLFLLQGATSLLSTPVICSLLSIPVICFAVLAFNVVLFQAAVLGRPLKGCHYSFLAVGTAYFILITVFARNAPGLQAGTVPILEPIIQVYRAVTGDHRIFLFNNVPAFWIAERVTATALGLLLAWAARLRVARRQQLRPRTGSSKHTTEFVVVGAILGLFLVVALLHFCILCLGPDFIPKPYAAFWLAQRFGLPIGLVLGGLGGWLVSHRRVLLRREVV
jgi:hypothetical protein